MMMVLKRLLGLLTLSAYKPEVIDYRYPLSDRIRGNSIAMLNIGPGGCKVARGIRDNNHFRIVDVVSIPTCDVTEEIIKELQKRTDCASVIISINSFGTAIEELKDIKLKPGVSLAETLKLSPITVLGDHYEPGRAYHVLQNLEGNNGIYISIPLDEINKIIAQLEKNGLQVIKIQHGIYNMLRAILNIDSLCNQDANPIIKVPVVLDQTYLVALNTFVSWGPVTGHSVITPIGRQEDPFEQQERILTFFREFAETLRQKFDRDSSQVIEFIVLNSNVQRQALTSISQTLANETSLKIVTPNLPDDIPSDHPEFFGLLLN